jgi:hypothetical protein
VAFSDLAHEQKDLAQAPESPGAANRET